MRDIKILWSLTANYYSVTVIHNEYNHVFGGFATESLQSEHVLYITDPTAFLYVVRPSCKVYKLNENEKKGESALCISNRYGPIYGSAIWISSGRNKMKDI